MDKINTYKMEVSEMLINDIRGALATIVDKRYFLNLQINTDTKFSEDLELDSVEYSKLFEVVINKYPQVPFVNWFSEKTIEEIMAIRVGDIVQVIKEYCYDNK